MRHVCVRAVCWLLAGAVLVLTPARVGAQTIYRFTTFDLATPQVSGVVVRSLDDAQNLLGDYADAQGRTHGFVRREGHLALLPLLNLQGLNNAGDFVGIFSVQPVNGLRGLLFASGQFTLLSVPLDGFTRASLTEAIGLNELRQVVGDYRDARGVFHGFLYDAQTERYTTIDAPFAVTALGVTGINNLGHLSGLYFDTHGVHGFLRQGSTFTTLDVPGAIGGTEALGLNDLDEVVGIASFSATGAEGNKGFVYKDGGYTVIEVPGAVLTELATINNWSELGGRFMRADGVSRGVIASPRASRTGIAAQVPQDETPAVQAGAAVTLDLGLCPPGSLRWMCRERP